MPFYNASQAARELNVPDKTIRRWLKQGLRGRWKLTAQRTESGQLLISEADILRIKHAREQERAQFDRSSSPVPSESSMPSQDLSALADLSQQVAQLTAKVVQLEERIATLESAQQMMPNRDEIPLVMPSPQLPTPATSPKPRPQKRTTTRKSDLPEGCILASKFAEQLGIPRRTFADYMLLGFGKGLIGMSTDTIPQKEMIEYSERPKPGREHTGEKERYLDPIQQEQAIALLKKHGKLSTEGQ